MHFTISQHPRHAMVGKEVEQSSKSKILEFPISAASLRSISEIHPTERILPNTVRSKLRGMYPSYDSRMGDEILSHSPEYALSPIELEAIQTTQRITLELRNSVTRDGADFLLVHGSYSYQVQFNGLVSEEDLKRNPFRDSQRWMSTFSQENSVNYLDLVMALRDFSFSNHAYIHGCEQNHASGHWSVLGHRVAAEQIYQYLFETGLIPGTA